MKEVVEKKQNTKTKQNIFVSIKKYHKYYISTTRVDNTMIDSLLSQAINKSKATVDTPTVVINADTTAYYGEVFRIMRLSKRSGAKVVANVK